MTSPCPPSGEQSSEMHTSKSLMSCWTSDWHAAIRKGVRLYCGMQIEKKGVRLVAGVISSQSVTCLTIPPPVAHPLMALRVGSHAVHCEFELSLRDRRRARRQALK